MAKTAKKKNAKKETVEKRDPISNEMPALTPTEPSEDDAQLTIADLQNIAKLIDLATRRGAFGAGEMSDVGIIYDKLSRFLNIIAQQKAEAEVKGGV